MKGYKTIAFGILVAVLAGLQAIDGTMIDAKAGVIVGVAIVVLRAVTTGPMFDKPAEPSE